MECTADEIRCAADMAVMQMGDIFFDPDELHGEMVVPEHAAINAVVAAIMELLTTKGVSIQGEFRPLPITRGSRDNW